MGLLSSVVAWSLANRPVVLVATLLFALFGLRAAATLPIDAVPDITSVQVQIITSSPALSPVEVEQYVTVPIERAMAGIPRTEQVRSISKLRSKPRTRPIATIYSRTTQPRFGRP